MTETLHRVTPSLPTQRTTPPPASSDAAHVDWSQPTPESRRLSELEQLQIDLAAGR